MASDYVAGADAQAMLARYDVIVVGLGAMGSAAAFHLASQGLKVLGLDHLSPPHTHGSTHGESRIIRQAYWEDPAYVPLVQRAYELWNALEAQSGTTLLRRTGALLMGGADGEVIPGATAAALAHGLRHEPLDADQVRRRWPQFRPRPEMSAILEQRAGALDPEAAVTAHLAAAAAAGADLRTNIMVTRWTANQASVHVDTDSGSFEATQLVGAVGPWAPGFWGAALPGLWVERQVQFWIRPKDAAAFAPASSPIFAIEPEPGVMFYGFPDFGAGVKVAVHHRGLATSPEHVDRTVSAQETADIRRLLGEFVPGLDVEPDRASVCLYTNAPDTHFVLGRHPRHENVVVCSPCSGHGFKFAAVVGQIVADLCSGRRPKFDLGLFEPARLDG